MEEELEIINRYFKNDLTKQELANFKAKLASDTAFARKVETHSIGNDAINLYEQIYFRELLKKESEKTTKTRPIKIVLTRIAAVLIPLILVGSYWALNIHYSTQNIFERHFIHYYEGQVKGTTENNDIDNYSLGLEAYENEKFNSAINLFLKVPQKERNHKLSILIANCYLKTNQPKLAIAFLENIKNSKEYHEEVNWYLSLAYLSNGQLTEAERTFQYIISQQSSYSSTATSALNDINSWWRNTSPKEK